MWGECGGESGPTWQDGVCGAPAGDTFATINRGCGLRASQVRLSVLDAGARQRDASEDSWRWGLCCPVRLDLSGIWVPRMLGQWLWQRLWPPQSEQTRWGSRLRGAGRLRALGGAAPPTPRGLSVSSATVTQDSAGLGPSLRLRAPAQTAGGWRGGRVQREPELSAVPAYLCVLSPGARGPGHETDWALLAASVIGGIPPCHGAGPMAEP